MNYDDKFNYFINDNSENICNIYKLLKKEEPETIINNLNTVKQKNKNKDKFLKLEKSYNDVYEYIVISKMSTIRFGLVGLNHNYDRVGIN